ncbi:response regulator transcription factor [Marinobacterium aestuariivivens]|uniref:Response regulator transcription factor n=1 Tax=Marinobacterium aestuariivivens TaxID=1698799 RepID=A0ABW1ZUL5_9GAMM
MKQNRLIYVVDDEADICTLVCDELNRFGYETRSFNTGGRAAQAIRRRLPDLCIVDLGLPDMDGLGLVRELCAHQGIGIMILSGRDSTPDRVLGLELGADDYITKPFEPRELVARANSLLRRLEQIDNQDGESARRRASFADWTFDPGTLTLTRSSGESEVLSTAEAELLDSLLRAPRQILSRDQLLGERADPFDRSIDVRMSRIRKKIETDPKNPSIIKTIYGAGYMLAAEVRWSQ